VAPTALPNLIKFCNENLGTHINPKPATVEPGSPDIFNYAFVHATGNGNIYFSKKEAENLRKYLISGGFLNINDSYGMDKYVLREQKKVFPNKKLVPSPILSPSITKNMISRTACPKSTAMMGNRHRGSGFSIRADWWSIMITNPTLAT